MAAILGNARVNGARLIDRLAALATIGDTGDGGARRLALTDEDREGRDFLCQMIREAGLTVHVDAIGNIVGVLAGREDGPAVIMGSHIDTVGSGGRYDGALGVMAGLEVLATLKDRGMVPRRPMAVIAFTNEEGARFQPDLLGSCVWTGDMTIEEGRAARDLAGKSVGEELDRIGYAGPLAPGAIPAHAYLELHIEQGPVLDATGGGLAAVTGVQAITWLEVTVTGEANHAGTTPMAFRKDPMVVAARAIAYAPDLTRRIDGLVVNVGRIAADPGNVNVVPRRVTFTLDIRHPEDAKAAEGEAWLRGYLERMAEHAGCGVTFADLARFPAQPFDETLVTRVEEAAKALGHRVRRMPSGAGHDAQMMATICPTAMIFVPSVGGKSHTPDEFTRPEDLIAGADVLLAVAWETAEG
jgi:beta-ureidopropionase / N-carbamoyl-L-amino-acid hydrolase